MHVKNQEANNPMSPWTIVSRTRRLSLAGCSLVILTILHSVALPAVESQAAEEDPKTALAQKAQNPISDLMRIPFQNNTHFGIGPNHRTAGDLKIQPVIPFALNRDWDIITRTILPIVKQPTLSTTDENTWGLGPTQFSAVLSPSRPGSLFRGVGPIFQFPTTTDDALGSRKWGAGPTAAVFYIDGPWAVGFLSYNVWSFAGNSGNPNYSHFLAQYFFNYNFREGWYLTSSPIMTANWEATSGNKWTVPVGGGIGKVFYFGGQSFSASLQAFSNVVRPDPGPDWTLRFQLALLLPRLDAIGQ